MTSSVAKSFHLFAFLSGRSELSSRIGFFFVCLFCSSLVENRCNWENKNHESNKDKNGSSEQQATTGLSDDCSSPGMHIFACPN